MSSAASVSVIIVTYNSAAWMPELLSKLIGEPEVSEIIVVDNDSVDGTVAACRGFPQVAILEMGRNAGFAAGCNAGVAVSSAELVLLLNPDAIPHAGMVSALAQFHESREGFRVVGGRTVDDDGIMDPRNCWARPTLWSLFVSAIGLTWALPAWEVANPEAMPRFDRDSARDVDIVTGCLFLVRRDLWEILGGMDEDYFMYGEDADFCARVWEMPLGSCAITPHAVLTHSVGGSSPNNVERGIMVLAGRVEYLIKRWAVARATVGRILVIGGVLVRLGFSELTRRPDRELWRTIWRRRSEWVNGWRGNSVLSVGSS